MSTSYFMNIGAYVATVIFAAARLAVGGVLTEPGALVPALLVLGILLIPLASKGGFQKSTYQTGASLWAGMGRPLCLSDTCCPGCGIFRMERPLLPRGKAYASGLAYGGRGGAAGCADAGKRRAKAKYISGGPASGMGGLHPAAELGAPAPCGWTRMIAG